MTEKELLHKREGKKRRRQERLREMTDEQIEDKEIAQYEKMMVGHEAWIALARALPQSDKFEELCRANSDTPSSST